MSSNNEELALALHSAGLLKFGTFTLKSGISSPFYIDLRLLASYPSVLRLCADALADLIKDVSYDRIAAIPMGGLPIGTALALRVDRPMIFTRAEKKLYGTGKLVEGIFNVGESVIVVDDLITKGGSKFEAIAPLTEVGLIVKDIAVVLDRESGGTRALAEAGINVHSVLRLTEMLDILSSHNQIASQQRQIIDEWLTANS
jgi:orotate phosphoribosyltransferase